MFLNPVMLAGLGAAALPLVLHLLSRARCRTVDFPGMMFLDDVQGRQHAGPQLKQAALLAMRTGLIVLLSLALARPVVSGRWWGGGASGKTSAVILVDTSASMGYDENGRTRMDLAREAVLQILATLHRGDQAAMIPSGFSAIAADQFTADLQSLALKASELTPGSGQCNIALALDGAVKLLDSESARQSPNRRVYVVCDRQGQNWRDVSEGFAKSWRSRIKGDAANFRLTVVPVGGLSGDNIGIESVELVNGPAIRGQSADLEVHVHNYGDARRDAIGLNCQLDSRSIAAAAVNLGAGQTQSVRLRISFLKSGSQALGVEIKPPAPAIEPKLTWCVDVIEPIEVLIISGREQKGRLRSESDYLRLALEPFQGSGADASNVARVKVVPSEEWNVSDLSKYRVVFLVNVPHLTPGQVQAIEGFVFSGGGVCIAPGNLVRPEDYNQSLYRDGAGILPAILSTPTPSNVGATTLLGLDVNHPVFRFVKGRSDPIPSASVWRYFPSIVSEDQNRVLASYASGKAFLIEKQFGRGRVLLMTTSLDMDWASLPLSSFYLPFTQSMVRYLASGEVQNRNQVVGQAISVRAGEGLEDQSVQIRSPDGKILTEGVSINHSAAQSEIRFDDPAIAGDYLVSFKTSRGVQSFHYGVRTPPEESDLTPLGRDQWGVYQQRLGFDLVENPGQGLSNQLHDAPASIELWPYLLVAVLGLALAELTVTRIWTSGVPALAGAQR